MLKDEFMEIKIERLKKISTLPSDVCLQEHSTESLQQVLKSFPAVVWRRESLPFSFHGSAGKTDSLFLGFRIVIKLGDLWVTTLKTRIVQIGSRDILTSGSFKLHHTSLFAL